LHLKIVENARYDPLIERHIQQVSFVRFESMLLSPQDPVDPIDINNISTECILVSDVKVIDYKLDY